MPNSLQQIHHDSVAVMEEQSQQIEESLCPLYPPTISQAETSEPEAEGYGGVRPKTIKRVKQRPTIPVEVPVQARSRVGCLMKNGPKVMDQDNSQHTVLLWDEIFNTISGMVNVNSGAAAWTATYIQGSEADKVFNSERMNQVLDAPIT